SVLGVLLTFGTLRAAISAKKAVAQVQRRMKSFDLATDLAAALQIMTEIPVHNKSQAWDILADRYGHLRRLLVQIKAVAGDAITTEAQTTIGGVLVQLSDLQKQVTTAAAVKTSSRSLNVTRMNNIVFDQIDSLHEILVRLRQRAGN